MLENQVIIAHFKSLFKEHGAEIKNAVIILWVSPEQRYYIDAKSVMAIVDLFNKCFDSGTCQINIVVADYLQRFNYYNVELEAAETNEHDTAALSSLQMGTDWWNSKREIFRQLSICYKKISWKELLLTDDFKGAKSELDLKYESDAFYEQQLIKTAEIFFNSKKGELQIPHEIFIHNSQHYLREECSFIYALPKFFQKDLSEGKNIYVVYPSAASPAIKGTIDFVNERYFAGATGRVQWLPIDLKARNTEKFNLQLFLSEFPYHGCSLSVRKNTQGGKHKFFLPAVINPEKLDSDDLMAFKSELDNNFFVFYKLLQKYKQQQNLGALDVKEQLDQATFAFIKLLSSFENNLLSLSSSKESETAGNNNNNTSL